MDTDNLNHIILKPGKERSVNNFHPWVFSGAVKTDVKQLNEGELVKVFNSDGNYLATGHFHHGSIMVRIISFSDVNIDLNFWVNNFRNALEVRNGLPLLRKNSTCFRLIHGEGDFLPGLVIDIYNKCAVVQTHSTGMQLQSDIICEALLQIDELELDTIYNKPIESGSAASKTFHPDLFYKGNLTEDIVTENGLKFYVNWIEGQKTGFFIDQRENRKLLESYSANKKVLNTFCYSGGFSIYALNGKASHVDSVDSSKKAIEWTDKNVSLNFSSGVSHNSYCNDVFEFLKSQKNEYDLIILDPPAFAKHLSAVKKAVVGYRNLNHEAIKRIKHGGIIFTFSCSQAIDKQLFRKTVFTAAAAAKRKVRILHQLSQASDHPVNIYHPESEYLKGLVLRVD